MKRIFTILALALVCWCVGTTKANAQCISENPYYYLSFVRISQSDLNGLSKGELRLMRNAIYARHGYIFKSDDLYNHFSMFCWYNPCNRSVDGMLSKLEHQNVAVIKQKEGTMSSSAGSVASSNPFLFLSNYYLSKSDLSSLSQDELRIMRNAIYARHGYIFKKAELKRYFGQFSWYRPRYNDVSNMLNACEKHNISVIKSLEW